MKIFVFLKFNVTPTYASKATNSSNIIQQKERFVQGWQNISMSSANCKPSRGHFQLVKGQSFSFQFPPASFFACNDDKAISSNELNQRGLSTHPSRAQPRTSNPQLSASRFFDYACLPIVDALQLTIKPTPRD